MKAIVSLEQLRQMCHIPALSGCEENMIRYMKAEMLKVTPHVSVDKLGNVIGRIDGTSKTGPKVMMSAHMDEIGFMVRKIEGDGFLRITRVGGVPEKSLPAQRVEVQSSKGAVFGVIGPKSHHATSTEEKFKVVPIEQLYVDVGARSKADAMEMGIYVGSPVTYHGFFQEMAGGQIAGKAIDNRAGCFVLLQVMRLLSAKKIPATVYYVGSVQEEFNIRGVVSAGYAINPDMAIVVDGGGSSDTPDLKGFSDIHLGGGPIIKHYSFHGRGTLNGLIPNPKMRQYFTDVAAKLGMPVQNSVFLGGLAESSYLTVLREGIPCLDLGAPMRYSHSPVEIGSLPDLDQEIQLIVAGLEGIGPDFDVSRG